MSTVDRITTLQEAIRIANLRWPGLVFTEKIDHCEASSACPWCGGRDRFSIFKEGNYACIRPGIKGHCGRKGWILEKEMAEMSRQERRMLALESKQRQLEQQVAEQEARLKALEKLVKEQQHIVYHRMLNDRARDYWHSEGIYDNSIERWMLGYCEYTPLYHSLPSFTIPIVNNGKLRDIRHRLDHQGKPKYLPHAKHLPRTLFNADRIIKPSTSYVILVEGEKKVMVLEQNKLPTVGAIGINGFDESWAKWFNPFRRVYVCYDMDAQEKGAQIAQLFGRRGRVLDLPVNKPDDYFNHRGDLKGFLDIMRKARMP